ncbi:hypothetical protein NHX12_030934 [Muraenolepis orangiensis]|uniref:Uncharacterized protein n=1 Tax=Muraenolepis orangiensis TaxID=630683 RepID=A0A9Q0INC4_9TELE|nr:hypothetical protein NHX12_030934 [Muraenolepis orangiensis]
MAPKTAPQMEIWCLMLLTDPDGGFSAVEDLNESSLAQRKTYRQRVKPVEERRDTRLREKERWRKRRKRGFRQIIKMKEQT